MNRIECNDCGEIVETSVTTVKFPYSCTSCISDNLDSYEADFDAYYDNESCACGNCEACEGQKYEDMAPAGTEEISMEEVLGTPLNPTDALIADLKQQNEDLTKEIEYTDARATKYMIIAKQEGVLRVSAEAQLTNLQKQSGTYFATKAALEQSQREVLEYQKQVDELKDKTDVYLELIEGMADAVRKAADAMVSLR